MDQRITADRNQRSQSLDYKLHWFILDRQQKKLMGKYNKKMDKTPPKS